MPRLSKLSISRPMAFCQSVTSCNTLKIMLTNLGNVPYTTRGFPAVPEIFLHFSEACCSIPAISKTDPYPSLQLLKNPKTREPEMTRTQSDPTRALHRDDLTRP